MTRGAHGCRHVVEQILAVILGAGIIKRLFQMRNNSAESGLAAALFAFTIQQQSLSFVGQFFKGSAQADSVRRRGDIDHVDQICRGGARTKTTFEQWFRPVNNNLGRIEVITAAKSMTPRTSAVRAL